ncbi:hypothetical protein ACFWBI_39800, partial [Streptomyces sp. NPDC059982]|uniref:hypothetical protein n=1 Tax=Streptomyces sp. NPDC059982 TaxID=3347024 RepID=UPI0036AB8E2D
IKTGNRCAKTGFSFYTWQMSYDNKYYTLSGTYLKSPPAENSRLSRELLSIALSSITLKELAR